MFQRKGQSSVEYLGTYAWAFLGLIVTVGALNYFGIFNPSGYTPEQCESGSQISCEDIALYTDTSNDNTTILLMLKNNYPRRITIADITMNKEQIAFIGKQENLTVEPARTITFTFDNTIKMVPGQKEQLSFTITYRRYQGSINHTISGVSTVNVQEQPSYIPYCGNGFLDAGEACDYPNSYEHIAQVSWTCRSDCSTI